MTMGQGLYGLNEPELPKKPPSKWRWVWNVVFMIMFVIGSGLFMLTRVANTSDEMKATVESIIGDASGLDAKIKTLNAISFFPVVGLDISDMALSPKGAFVPVITVAKANYSTGFWSVLMGNLEFRTVFIENAVVNAGHYVARDLAVRSLALDINDPAHPKLVLDAIYGGEVLKARIDLDGRQGLNGHMRFTIARRGVMDVTLGHIQMVADFIDPQARSTTINITTLRDDRYQNDYTGSMVVSGEWSGLRLAGQIDGGQDSAVIFNLTIKPDGNKNNIDGMIKTNGMDRAALEAPGGLLDILRTVLAFTSGQKKDEPMRLGRTDANITISLEHGDAPPLTTTLIMVDGKVPQDPLRGAAAQP